MFRQVSSRNHRNKGLKVKHALQIFLLVAVCFWLLYQVKHSHDEKKAFEERNAHELQNRQDILKLGRKDLSQNRQVSSGHGLNDQSEEGKEGEEEEVEDESKQEENDQEENDQEDSTEEDTDQNDEEKSEEESETREDTMEEESENKKEEGEGDENEERESNEEKVETNEQEESEESKENAHEAREAHYTGDDASSAVVKLDTERAAATELNVEKFDDEHKERIDIENNLNDTSNHADEMMNNGTLDSTLSQDKNVDNSTFLTIENEEMPGNVTTGTEVKDKNLPLPTIESEVRNNITAEGVHLESHLDTSGNMSLSDSTTTEGIDQIFDENRSVETNTENATLPLGKDASVESKNLDQNSTSETVDTSEQENARAFVGNDTSVAIPGVNHNSTLEIEKNNDEESPNLHIDLSEPGQQLNATTEESKKMMASNTTLGANEEQTENLKAGEDSGDSGDPSIDDKLEIDIVKPEESQTAEVAHEVREALTDLGTLPEIDTHGQSIEDVAAE